MSDIIQAVSWLTAIGAIVYQVKAIDQFSDGKEVEAYRSESMAVIVWIIAYLILVASKMVM